jgi:hypothetical protein
MEEAPSPAPPRRLAYDRWAVLAAMVAVAVPVVGLIVWELGWHRFGVATLVAGPILGYGAKTLLLLAWREKQDRRRMLVALVLIVSLLLETALIARVLGVHLKI